MDDINNFKLFLIRKGLRPSTVGGHLVHLKKALPHLSDMDDFLLTLAETNNLNYLNNIISTLRIYGAFTKDKKLTKLKYFKRQATNKATMDDSEIEAFLALTCEVKGTYAWHYAKNTLLWMCCAFSGARIGEIASLTIEQVDFGRGIFTVSGKTGFRSIPIATILLQPLREHIAKLKGNYLFPSMRTDRPMERSAWNFDFKQRLKRLGIKRQNLTPYSLRHSFITRMLDEDVNIFKVQQIVGHKQITTTAKYTHLTTKSIQNAIKKDPLGKKNVSYEERFKFFREGFRQLIEAHTNSIEEERKMIKELATYF